MGSIWVPLHPLFLSPSGHLLFPLTLPLRALKTSAPGSDSASSSPLCHHVWWLRHPINSLLLDHLAFHRSVSILHGPCYCQSLHHLHHISDPWHLTIQLVHRGFQFCKSVTTCHYLIQALSSQHAWRLSEVTSVGRCSLYTPCLIYVPLWDFLPLNPAYFSHTTYHDMKWFYLLLCYFHPIHLSCPRIWLQRSHLLFFVGSLVSSMLPHA